MADKVTVTSRTWYGQRIGGSFKKIFWGILLVIGSIILLARNENNFVKQKAALNEGEKNVVEATASPVDVNLDGKLVHLDGDTHSPMEQLQDSAFWVTTEDLKLQRTVEMYQWEEDSQESCRDNVWWSEECTTTYSYTRKWKDSAINSDQFYEQVGHENPTSWEYESKSWQKEPILVGDLTLSEVFVNQLTKQVSLLLTDQELVIPEKYKETVVFESTPTASENLTGEDTNQQDEAEQAGGGAPNTPQNQLFHVFESYLYIGKNPSQPEVGDLKVSFSTVKAGTVSIVGQQNGNELSSYTASNGRSIALLESWKVGAETMFANAHTANRTMTWVLRFLGLFLMFIGFSMMFEFLVTLAKVLPFLSNILGVGVSLVALALTLVLWLWTIAIAWLVVRPIVGIALLVIGIWWAVVLVKIKKNKKLETNQKPEA